MKTRSKFDDRKSDLVANATLFEYPSVAATKESNRNRIIYTKHDHKQLQPPGFLNDTIISFFMQYHLDLRVERSLKDRIHIFNSFFFAKIRAITQNKNSSFPSYGHASRWLKNVKLFEKDFLIMPVCEHDHWLLVIVCYPARSPNNSHDIDDQDLFQPAVFVLNSCIGIAPSIKKALSQFLRYQWQKERGTDRLFSIQSAKRNGIRLVFPELPQQKNNYDCGVYILGYFYSFLNDPREAYVRMFRKHNLRSWFKDNNIDISRERRRMITVIKNQIATWASTHEANGAQVHEMDSQEIHISSRSSSSSSNGYVDLETDVDGNDRTIIVIH